MSKKEQILFLYFEKKMAAIEISKEVNVVKSYVTKILKKDERYATEKLRRKEDTKIRKKNFNRENMRKVRKRDSDLNNILKIQHIQDSCELSSRRTINNQAFRNWNSSIYQFYNRTKEYRIIDELKDKTSYAVPQKIKWK